MKRIANKAAVQTICYTISGNQKVRIVDYENDYDCSNDRNGNVVYEGLLKEKYGNWSAEKYFNSECHGIKLDGDTIVFSVFTKFEQY